MERDRWVRDRGVRDRWADDWGWDDCCWEGVRMAKVTLVLMGIVWWDRGCGEWVDEGLWGDKGGLLEDGA